MTQAPDRCLSCGPFTVEYCHSLTLREREIHPYHELLYCDEPGLILRTENSPMELNAACLVLIPMGCYHLFDLSRVKRFTRLKIAIEDEFIKSLPLSLFPSHVSVIDTVKGDARLLLHKLTQAMQEEESPSRAFYVRATVMMLLAELGTSEMTHTTARKTNDESTLRVIAYVAEHLSEDLSIEALAERENFSPSFLTHTFKKEMGMSLHRYVMERRLIRARERLDAGEKPSKIFMECGYSDYSSFYKAYLHYFDTPPSKEKK